MRPRIPTHRAPPCFPAAEPGVWFTIAIEQHSLELRAVNVSQLGNSIGGGRCIPASQSSELY